MTTSTTTSSTTQTLEAPGALLTYDVRRNDGSDEPVLFLIGSPMGAAGFGTLAGYFADRTVVTYDPRGVERSECTDEAAETTPGEHADDLHRIVEALGRGPVDLFASSGGAVNALVLVATHPDDVRTLVAHEPPAARYVADSEAALAISRDIHETYLREGQGAAMAKFIALVSRQGELTMDYLEQPAPDPAMFGLPTEDDGTRDDPLLGQNMVPSTHAELDVDAIKAASTRVVLAVGIESEGQLARRAGEGVAQGLGQAPVIFPSGHGGFLGGEYGQTGDPDAFAAKLREVLD
jgi:pimeloyl-ACP methyl ester carboxylesterase